LEEQQQNRKKKKQKQTTETTKQNTTKQQHLEWLRNELVNVSNVLEKRGGLPPIQLTNKKLLVDASHDDKPYNKNSYPGVDPTSYYIGETTPLDQMNINDKGLLISADPMNTNWGGNLFTQKLIDKGYYKDNNVNIFVP
jgi:hypothetical protein